MPYFHAIIDFLILPIVALYSAFTLYGMLGVLILIIYILISLAYIFSRSIKYTEPKDGWKSTEDMSLMERKEKSYLINLDSLVFEKENIKLYIYLYLIPLSILIISFLYFQTEQPTLYISIFLLFIAFKNSSHIVTESYITKEQSLKKELDNYNTNTTIDNLEKNLDKLNNFVNRLSIASGFDEKKIREIENLAFEIEMNEKLYKTIENFEEDNEESERITEEDDSWEKIIWKWADTYKIPDLVIPRNRKDLLNITSLNLTPFSVNPILSMSNFGHTHRCNESIITTIPKEIFYLKNLTELDSDDTNIDNLPIEISNLTKLKIISIANTNISKLPKELGKLRELKYLNVSGTKIDNIHEAIKKLPNLKILQRN